MARIRDNNMERLRVSMQRSGIFAAALLVGGSKSYFDDISIRNKHKIRMYSKLFCII